MKSKEFNTILGDYECPRYDPYWDEIVLDVNPTSDATGQLTLLYDDSEEPPDPDDYPDLAAYHQAWEKWEVDHLGLTQGFSVADDYDIQGVTESTSQPHKDDSVTTANLYTVPLLEGAQPESVSDSVTHFGCVNEYIPKGQARGGKKYFCYSYRGSGRVHHIHIPGGNTSSPVAQSRAEKVRLAIIEGKPPTEIIAIIKSQ